VVVTNATLDGNKFSEYFGGCPLLHVPGRAFPVDIVHSVRGAGWRRQCRWPGGPPAQGRRSAR
jgi:HrpA-like RNA helicase